MSSSAESAGESYTDLAHKIDPTQVEVRDPTDDHAEVVARYPWNGGRHQNGRLGWGEEYDIYSGFLPFGYLDDSPIEILTEIGKFLAERPVTKQRISTTELTTRTDLDGNKPATFQFEDACLLHGWWRGGKTSTGGAYYCNPDYCHDHPEDDLLQRECYWDGEQERVVNERIEFAVRATRLGLSSPTVYRAYGLDDYKQVTRWLANHGFEWTPHRNEGIRRMGRTYKTIREWGHSYYELETAFGAPRQTISGRAARVSDGFEVPADPSYRVIKQGEQ